MASNSLLSRWFGTKPKPKDSAEQSTSVDKHAEQAEHLSVAPVKQVVSLEEKPTAFHASLENAKMHWGQHNTLKERAALMQEHPFFQDPHYVQHLDIEMYLSFIRALTSIHKAFNRFGPRGYQQLFQKKVNGPFSSDDKQMFQAAQKGNAAAFEHLQEHGFVLANKFPEAASELYGAMASHWNTLFNNEICSTAWLKGFEQLAQVGVLPSLVTALHPFYLHTKHSPNIVEQLQEYPLLHSLFLNPKDDGRAVHWAIQTSGQMAWLVQCHPRINEWDLAQAIGKSYPKEEALGKITEIANGTPAGALMKSWFGIELSVEEMTKHPLAHSLYVHKHAPMYLEEVKPLPTSWTIAMSLAETGRQFCDALVQTAKVSLGQETPQSIELPNLDGPPL